MHQVHDRCWQAHAACCSPAHRQLTRTDCKDSKLRACFAGNEFASEALPGALPKGQNNPRHCPYGLYAEQLSGTAFTVPRRVNQRSWLYRIRPSVVHEPFHAITFPNECLTANTAHCAVTPNQLRWRPFPLPQGKTDFVRALFTVCGAGNCAMREGYAIHVYSATASMDDTCLANADGDFLLVPQAGAHLRVYKQLLIYMNLQPCKANAHHDGRQHCSCKPEGCIRCAKRHRHHCRQPSPAVNKCTTSNVAEVQGS